MMRNLFFRIDPALGIRKLRQEVWIAIAVILGIALLVAVEIGENRRHRAKAELVIEDATLVEAGERILPVNKEIWDLVEGSSGQEPSKTAAAAGVALAPSLPTPSPRASSSPAPSSPTPSSSTLSQSTSVLSAAESPAVPRFPSGGEKPVTKSVTASVAAEPLVFESHQDSRIAAAATSTIQDSSLISGNAWGMSNNSSMGLAKGSATVSDLGSSLGSGLASGIGSGAKSGVAYKRLDDQAIQNRDSAQVEQIAGLPIGTMINAELITGIISGSPSKVLMLVKKDVVLHEMVVIPAGAVFLGTSVPDYKAGRINVNVEWLICGNAEIKVSGLAYDAFGQAGLVDRRINAAARKLIPAFFAGILAEFADALSGRQAVIPELALVKGTEASPTMQVMVGSTSSGLDAVAQVLAEQAAQEGTVLIANPGKLIKIVLLQKIPFDTLVGAGGGSR